VVGWGDDNAFGVCLFDGFVDFQLVAFLKSVLGTERDPNLFSIDHLNRTFDIAESCGFFCSSAFGGESAPSRTDIEFFDLFDNFGDGFHGRFAQSAIAELAIVAEAAARPGTEVICRALFYSSGSTGGTGHDFTGRIVDNTPIDLNFAFAGFDVDSRDTGQPRAATEVLIFGTETGDDRLESIIGSFPLPFLDAFSFGNFAFFAEV